VAAMEYIAAFQVNTKHDIANFENSHSGNHKLSAVMNISESDWSIFLEHAGATMKVLQIPQQACDDVVKFVMSLKDDIVET
jgi:uncharacterized membrane protein